MTDATPSPDETALDDLDASPEDLTPATSPTAALASNADLDADGRPDSADAAIEAAMEAAGPDDPAATQSPTDAQVSGTQG